MFAVELNEKKKKKDLRDISSRYVTAGVCFGFFFFL